MTSEDKCFLGVPSSVPNAPRVSRTPCHEFTLCVILVISVDICKCHVPICSAGEGFAPPFHAQHVMPQDCQLELPKPTASAEEQPRIRQHIQMFTRIMTSEVTCFDVPWSSKVFLCTLDVSTIFSGSPGRIVIQFHFAYFS